MRVDEGFFGVFFVLGGLLAVGWSRFLWGVLSRFIKLLVERMVGSSPYLKNRMKKSIVEADVPWPAWTQKLILKRRSSADLIWPFQKATETWRCSKCIKVEVVIDYYIASGLLWTPELLLLPSLPLLSCWELRFWSSKPGQPHDCGADGNNLCAILITHLRPQRGLGNSSSVAGMDLVPEEQHLDLDSVSHCKIGLVLPYFIFLGIPCLRPVVLCCWCSWFFMLGTYYSFLIAHHRSLPSAMPA